MFGPTAPPGASPAIRHLSDTALWVASFRALEGGRRDAAFSDPLAALLAGERGRAIARDMPRAPTVEWAIIIRTAAIDRLIQDALSAGVDTVLNLGAGLDTRPYRMPLPATLRWVEADFPAVVELKNTLLRDHQSSCKIERVAIDLRDRPRRQKFLAELGGGTGNILAMTEGVLPYLPNQDVASLATDLLAIPSIGGWIQDFDNAGRRRLPRGWEQKLRAAPLLFDVRNWFEFFETYGWRPSRVITSIEEARRIKRPYPIDFPFGLVFRVIPKSWRDRILSLSGAALMQRATA